MGFGILISLLAVAIAVPLYAPYDVVSRWSDRTEWTDNPRLAAPEWSELISGRHEPRTMIVEPNQFRKIVARPANFNYTSINTTKSFAWTYDDFPSELSLTITAHFPGQSPSVRVWWYRPDGRNVLLLQDSLKNESRDQPRVLAISSDKTIVGNIRDWLISLNVVDPSELGPNSFFRPEYVLFAQVDDQILNTRTAHLLKAVPGTSGYVPYQLVIEYLGFTREDDISARFNLYGTVFGLAGTDDQRRDLLTGLLWGAPVALAFGSAAAVVIVLVQTLLGALSGWYGGPIDEFVQRASDFYLIIPTLPILILIALFYRPGIIAILFVLVAFGVVGSTTKVVRSIVLQIKEEQFIEAAESYGASRARILFKYIMPRVMPYTFALVALSVPAFIFVEASLSFLGLGDPVLPTWGAILGEAYTNGALFHNFWWWIVLPASGILYTTIGFALLGYAFDKVLNPRLREE